MTDSVGKETDIELIARYVSYDPETGAFTRSGRPFGSFSHPSGYGVLTMFGNQYRMHRVAWALHYGEWPANQIDHINRDRSDNRIANLRDATSRENNANRTMDPEACLSLNDDGTVTALIAFRRTFDTREEAIACREMWIARITEEYR